MKLIRRQFLHLGGASVATLALARVARSQAYPSHPVRLIVPYAAGGPTDVIGRVIAQKLSEKFGHQVFVGNLLTGAGNVGTGIAAKAPPDGYTAVVVTTSIVINPSLYAKLPYDPIKDFTPVSLVAASPHVLVVHPSVPANSVKDLIMLVRDNPGRYSYASPGTGQSGQLAGELFKLSLGLDLVHVPFNGAAPALTSTMGGHTPIAFLGLAGAAPNIREGKLRALAVTSSRRSQAFPDVPTLAEAGIPGQESVLWQGILFPAGTPSEIVERWHREISRIVALPDVNERISAIGFEPVVNTPEDFASQIKTEMTRWREVIRAANIQKVE